jgi:hypothetical protein
LWPSVECLEFATGERSDGTFGISDGLRLEGGDHEVDLFISNVLTINRSVGMKGMNGTESGRGDTKFVIRVIRSEVERIEKIELLVNGSAFTAVRQGFGSKREGDFCRRRVSVAETAEFAVSIGKSEHGDVLDGGEEGATKFLAGSKWCTADGVGAALGSQVGDEHAVGSGIGAEFETKSGILATNLESDIGFGSKRAGTETKRRNGSRRGIRGKRVALLHTLEVLYLGRDIGVGQVIHSLIETSTIRDLDSFGFNVKPEDVFKSVGKEAKEDSFLGMVAKFTRTRAGGTNPNATTKGAEVVKVGFGTMALFERRQGIVFAGKSIFNPKVVVKSVWPKSRFQARTSEHGAKSVANGLMSALDRAILVGTIGAGGSDLVTKLGKESSDLGVLIQFTALVEVNILFGDAGRVAK